MFIIEDTRQQAGKHKKKHEWWTSNGDNIIRCKLPFGDYALPPTVAVDTKANLTEIATNMCGPFHERRRFTDECKYAHECGCRLVFLIESTVKDIDDLYDMQIVLGNGREIKGEQLALAIRTMTSRYGCEFMLVKPSRCAQKINEILNGAE